DAFPDVVSAEVGALRAPVLRALSRLLLERVEHPLPVQRDVIGKEEQSGAVEPGDGKPRPALVQDEDVTEPRELEEELQDRSFQVIDGGVARASGEPHNGRTRPPGDTRKAHEGELD